MGNAYSAPRARDRSPLAVFGLVLLVVQVLHILCLVQESTTKKITDLKEQSSSRPQAQEKPALEEKYLPTLPGKTPKGCAFPSCTKRFRFLNELKVQNRFHMGERTCGY